MLGAYAILAGGLVNPMSGLRTAMNGQGSRAGRENAGQAVGNPV